MTVNVAAILVVRDEERLIERNVCFHLDMGFHTVAVLDHCSMDGTSDILNRLAADRGIVVMRDNDPSFDHARLSNRILSHVLKTRYADWIVPLDADEFFHAPGGVPAFVEKVSANGIGYGSVQWFNALWAESDHTAFGGSPLLTKWFYQPWPERAWQNAGHFRKSFCRVHSGMEVVVGGHYFRREANEDFFATQREPAFIPTNLARIYHYEFRDSVNSLFAKWRKLAQFEQDSSSLPDAPWMERLARIKSYVRNWEANPEEAVRFWSSGPRTFWGSPVPQTVWEKLDDLADWQANFSPRYDHLQSMVPR